MLGGKVCVVLFTAYLYECPFLRFFVYFLTSYHKDILMLFLSITIHFNIDIHSNSGLNVSTLL